MIDQLNRDGSHPIRTAFSLVCLVIFALALAYTAYRVVVYGPDLTVLQAHWIGVVGPVFAAIFSLFLVFLTKTVSGELKVEIGPINLSGAASESLFWVINFVAIVWAFSTLWELKVG
jgi:hypothetical protein